MLDFTKTMAWEAVSLKKFDDMIARLPLFHREIAHGVVLKKAEDNARERKSSHVEQQDIVRAFFSEVPKAFYSLMIRLMDEVGFDYQPILNSTHQDLRG